MNQKSGVSSLRDACRRNILNRTLEKYIEGCRIYDREEDTPPDAGKKRASRRSGGRFPNLAGFCRHYRISLKDLDALSAEFPDEINMLYAILEDEALNSGLPPAVLSAYLKKRLGYDRDTSPSELENNVTIRFEHDIFDDGE